MNNLEEQAKSIMKDLDEQAKSISEFLPSGSSPEVELMHNDDENIEITAPKDVEKQMESVVQVVEQSPAEQKDIAVVDPFQAREGRDLVWKEVNMTLAAKGSDTPERKLLDNVWGEVPKGQVTAIMGPSGSGKTSMLNILAGRVKSAGVIAIKADVRLNNYSVNPTDIEVRKKIAFVAQDDSLQVTATPREAIRFSARLRLPSTMNDKQIESLTNQMIAELGLQDCADTIVGGELIKGISGGERKRTSVGVELVTRPALVFLDEPTSGLDSFNAVHLCRLLKKVANAGSSVLFTIHQPSSDIFNSFDRLILLNKGRVMYQDSVQNVPTFFADRGHPCPPNYNPADWVMHVALSNTIQELNIAGYFPKDERCIGEPFSAEIKDGKDILGITDRDHNDVDNHLDLAQQTKFLFKREISHLIRNTHALKARTAMTCAISSVIGFIFYQVARLDFDNFINVQTTFGALLMSLLANVFSTALPSLMAFPAERPVFLREYSTNHYSVFSYFGSRLFMELFVTGVQVTVSSLITYFLIGFGGAYGYFWSGLYLMACASTALGVFVGCSVENPSVAVEFLPAIFMPQIIFSGFFIPPGLMPKWLAWIRHICPLTYGIKIVVAAEFGFGRCNEYVEKGEDNYCDTILKNTEVNVDDVWWYYLVLLSLFIVVRIFALFNLKRKAEKFY
jgi:ABC-type multidrug transport system ATPase subunit/ABC-type multidrug transport system permease subunit